METENKNQIKNVLDLSLIDDSFILAMLNLIKEHKEKQNGLSKNKNLFWW